MALTLVTSDEHIDDVAFVLVGILLELQELPPLKGVGLVVVSVEDVTIFDIVLLTLGVDGIAVFTIFRTTTGNSSMSGCKGAEDNEAIGQEPFAFIRLPELEAFVDSDEVIVRKLRSRGGAHPTPSTAVIGFFFCGEFRIRCNRALWCKYRGFVVRWRNTTYGYC